MKSPSTQWQYRQPWKQSHKGVPSKGLGKDGSVKGCKICEHNVPLNKHFHRKTCHLSVKWHSHKKTCLLQGWALKKTRVVVEMSAIATQHPWRQVFFWKWLQRHAMSSNFACLQGVLEVYMNTLVDIYENVTAMPWNPPLLHSKKSWQITTQKGDAIFRMLFPACVKISKLNYKNIQLKNSGGALPRQLKHSSWSGPRLKKQSILCTH